MVNKKLNLHLEEGGYGTLAGFVIDKLGKIPSEGEELKIDNIVLKIDKYEISSISDFSKAVKALKDTKKPVLFRLKRDKISLFIAVTPE